VSSPVAASRGLTLLAHSQLGGTPDSLQIMVSRGHAFVTHPFNGGFSVIDIRDPRSPRHVFRAPAPPGTMTLHLQLSDDILLVTNEADTSTRQSYLDKAVYFGAQLGVDAAAGLTYSAGLQVFDVADPAGPREIGRAHVPGFGIHRLWWTGGTQAIASSMPVGTPDFVLAVLDLSDPAQPDVRYHWGPPDQDDQTGRVSLHHAILAGTTAYGAWRSGGLVMVDVGGPEPRYVGGISPQAWGGGNTHTTLPLAARELVAVLDEPVLEDGSDGIRRIWLIDIAAPDAPRVVASLPEPSDRRHRDAGGLFGPHNLHENRPGTWQSETILFAAYQSAGVRVYDISDAAAPAEVAYSTTPAPTRTIDPRVSNVRVPQTADILVTAEGLVLASDLNAGLTLLQLEELP
jgi:hypothetical protein